MIRSKLGEGDPLDLGNTPAPPLPKGLRGKRKRLAYESATDSVDQRAIGMPMARRTHRADINAQFTDGKRETFIEINDDPPSIADVSAIAKLISEQIRLKLKALNMTPAELARRIGYSPQRLNKFIHISEPRAPDVESLLKICRALHTTPDGILGISATGPIDVSPLVLRLLELEGMPVARAEAIALIVQQGLQVLAALPADGDERTRARLAAQAVWQARQTPKPS